MDIPSLFMIPSAVSSGKVHSVFPNSTDADFQFNRDSDATRVNSEGLIERVGFYSAELVTNGSFDTDSDWNKVNATISGGQANMTVTGGVFSGVNQTLTLTSGKKYRLIASIKGALGSSGKQVRFMDNSSNIGGLTTTNGVITLNESVQNIELNWTANSNSNTIQNARNTSSGDYSWVLYNISVKEVIGDRARLNYEIEGGLVNTKPSLLLEPQSTNEVTYSEKFNEWSNVGGVTLTSDISKSPDGSISADGIQDTTGGSFKRIRIVIGSLSPNSTFTASVFVKKETSQINFGGIALVYQNVSTATSYGIIDAVNGTIVNGSGSITPTFNVVDFGNYWRFEMTSTDNGSNTAVEFAIYGTLSNNGTSLGVGAGSVRTIWGAQLEQQSYCTSYIPTNGSTQTRAAETCNGAGTSSILPSEEGILYAEIARPVNDSVIRSIALSDGSAGNVVLIQYYNNNIGIVVKVSSSAQAVFSISNTTLDFNKIAISWKSNSYKAFVNGTQTNIDTSGSTFSAGTLSEFAFDRGDGLEDFYGKIRDVRVYNTKEMTDSEVDILLTKITS